MAATLKDIAARVGVSKALVSMYLNNHKLSAKIAQKTKANIDLAVKELNYRPSYTAQALTNGKTRTIGLICGGITNPYFSNLIETALTEAAQQNYQLLLSLTPRWNQKDEEACFENLLQRQTDGVISCLHLRRESPLYAALLKSPIPICRLGATDDDFLTYNIQVEQAMDDAVAMLAQRGHRHIMGYFYSESDWPAAFQASCRKTGVEPQLQVSLPGTRDTVVETVAEIMEKKPTAIVINGCDVILELIFALHEVNSDYRPELVVGIDDYFGVSDPLIAGHIYSDSPAQIKNAVNGLIDVIENRRQNVPRVNWIAAKFFDAAKNNFRAMNKKWLPCYYAAAAK